MLLKINYALLCFIFYIKMVNLKDIDSISFERNLFQPIVVHHPRHTVVNRLQNISFFFFPWRWIWIVMLVFAGITDENLDKLLSHALIPMEKKNVITNMHYLNLQIIQEPSRVSDWSVVCSLFNWHLQRESGVSPDLGRATALHVASELFIKSSGVISLFSLFDIPTFFFEHESTTYLFFYSFQFLFFFFRLLMFCRHEFDLYFRERRRIRVICMIILEIKHGDRSNRMIYLDWKT